ncbi:protoporphyrinogen oxidase [Candidatus Mycalebacterium sp.]
MTRPKKIVVIGGGIAGLSAALEISDFGRRTAPSVEILESSDSFGGTISTVREDGFIFERGPDSFFADEAALEFCSKIGISPQLIGTSELGRRVFVMRGERAVALPDGFFMMAPRKIPPFLTSPFFSLPCKIRTLAEIFIPARAASETEESVADFIRRRFGDEIYEKAAAPLIGGIYCADPETLSAESVLPEFVKMERENGGVLRALLRGGGDKSGGGARFGGFVAPEGGMSEMVAAALRLLPGGCARAGFRVSKIVRTPGGWEIFSSSGEKVLADAVVMATPCGGAAEMLEETDSELARLLRSVSFSSCAVVNLAYENSAVAAAPDGFGVLFPEAGADGVFACSFLSRKFRNRAPEGFSVLRFFISGGQSCALTDEAITARARKAAETVFGAHGEPQTVAVGKYGGQMPVYRIGHRDLVSRIMSAADRVGRITFAGAAYEGVGIPRCIASGAKAGAKAAGFSRAGGNLRKPLCGV